MKKQLLWALRLLALCLAVFAVDAAQAAEAQVETTSSREAWILNVLLDLVPPEKMARVRHDGETAEHMKERYATIAHDLNEVIQTEKPLFVGDKDNYRMTALLLSLAHFESGFHGRVANGTWRGDNGRSWCYMQINIGQGYVPVGSPEMRKWRGVDLIEDPKKCFRSGLEILRKSLNACRSKQDGDVLSGYTAGSCRDNEPRARARWNFSKKILIRHPVTIVKAQPAPEAIAVPAKS